MRHFTTATYKLTELGQIGQSLNCTAQKLRRRKLKAAKIHTTLVELQQKEELSRKDEVQISRLQFEHKHELADVNALSEELKHLKELQAQKREKSKKQKEKIFPNEPAAEVPAMDDNEFLANLYGVQSDNAKEVPFDRL